MACIPFINFLFATIINSGMIMSFWNQSLFIRPFEKRDVLREHLRRAGGRRPQGFRSLSQRVFIGSLSNLVNMLVCIMSRRSSITSQIPHALLNYGTLIVQIKGFRSLSQRVFVLSLSILVNMLVGILSRPNSITCQIPPLRNYGTWLSKNWISGICSPSRISCFQKCCHYHWIYHKHNIRILCQFGTLVNLHLYMSDSKKKLTRKHSSILLWAKTWMHLTWMCWRVCFTEFRTSNC